MAIIDREKMLRFGERRFAELPADWIEPGAKIRIQSLKERERALLERQIENDKVSTRTRLIIAAVVDDVGNRLFDDSHAELIESWDAQAVAGLVELIGRHCDLNGSVVSIKDTAKN